MNVGPVYAPSTEQAQPEVSRYSLYVLFVLVLVSCISALDRQIISILAESIKADLGLSDTQVGFLYGTVFAVFHALFGLVLARIADVWSRQKLIAIALLCWSCLTALSGIVTNFWQLLSVRVGVSVGESVASPASFSLLAGWFPTRRRATALALYSAGAFIGAGLGMAIGGAVAHGWDTHFAGQSAPGQLRGWQVAFFVAGAPGLLLAIWTWTLRSPPDRSAPAEPAVPTGRLLWRELAIAIPPFSVITLISQAMRSGHAGKTVRNHLWFLAGIVMVAAGLIVLIGDPMQWIFLAIGCYSAGTWLQNIRAAAPTTARALLGKGTIPLLATGCGFLSAITSGIALWMAPYLMRTFGMDAAQAGWKLGTTFAISGWLGVTLGGVLSDRWRASSPHGRFNVALLSAALPFPLLWLSLHSETIGLSIAFLFLTNLAATLWVAAGSTSVQEVVATDQRTTASAFYFLIVTYVGMSLGPYVVGYLSDHLGDLRNALLGQAAMASLFAIISLVAAARSIAAKP